MNTHARFRILIFVFLAAGWSVRAQASIHPPMDQAVRQYIAISQALNRDDAQLAQREAATLPALLNKLHGSQAVLSAAQQLTGTQDLARQRVAFARLTVALYQLLLQDKPSSPLYMHYCPMAKAYWMDASKSIANPYLGSAMSSCGKTTGIVN